MYAAVMDPNDLAVGDFNGEDGKPDLTMTNVSG